MTMILRRFAGRLLLAATALGLSLASPLGSAAEEAPAESPKSIFIVAKPDIADPHFRETVIIVTHIGGSGPVGLIVNRPTRIPLSRVFPENTALRESPDHVYFGGPVSPESLIFLFRADARPEGAAQVLRDVFISSNPD